MPGEPVRTTGRSDDFEKIADDMVDVGQGMREAVRAVYEGERAVGGRRAMGRMGERTAPFISLEARGDGDQCGASGSAA